MLWETLKTSVKDSRKKEFVGLSPKMYSILQASCKEIKKAKMVIVKKDLRHEFYNQCLNERVEMKHKQVAVRSRGHQITVYERNKTKLSAMNTNK